MSDTLRLTYRPLSDTEKNIIKSLKDGAQTVIDGLDALGSNREFTIAKVKMEEFTMWAVKGITGPLQTQSDS